MQLSDGWMVFAILAFTMYIVLDGYDLGIGVLTLFERDTSRRRQMRDLVAWVWDGNESWLVLVALSLWSGVPLAFGVALPALYVPLILMLLGLIGRGVALELVGQQPGWRPLWGPLFSYCSLLVAFCQGAAFGGIVAGTSVRGGQFAGNPFSFLHDGYAVLTGLTAVALYVLAGCAWIYLRTDGEMQHLAAVHGRVAAFALAAGTAASWALAPVAGTVSFDAGSATRLPVWIVGAVVLALGLGFSFSSLHPNAQNQERGRAPVVATLTVYAGGLLLAGGLMYPTLVPPTVNVHAAASPESTLLFLIIGAGIFVPLTLLYQGFSNWVFRGKVHEEAPTS